MLKKISTRTKRKKRANALNILKIKLKLNLNTNKYGGNQIMKKSTFVATILGTIGGILFAWL